jgi:hypothetical protein
VPADACIAAPDTDRALIASLETQGGWRVDGAAGSARCDYLVIERPRRDEAAPRREGWTLVAAVRQPTDRTDHVLVFRRSDAGR